MDIFMSVLSNELETKNNTIYKRFSKLIGMKFRYKTYNDVGADFVITQKSLEIVKYFNSVDTLNDTWHYISDISWGSGDHYLLYGNMNDETKITLHVINDGYMWDGNQENICHTYIVPL